MASRRWLEHRARPEPPSSECRDGSEVANGRGCAVLNSPRDQDWAAIDRVRGSSIHGRARTARVGAVIATALCGFSTLTCPFRLSARCCCLSHRRFPVAYGGCRNASVVSAHTAEEVICVVCVAAPNRPAAVAVALAVVADALRAEDLVPSPIR